MRKEIRKIAVVNVREKMRRERSYWRGGERQSEREGERLRERALTDLQSKLYDFVLFNTIPLFCFLRALPHDDARRLHRKTRLSVVTTPVETMRNRGKIYQTEDGRKFTAV